MESNPERKKPYMPSPEEEAKRMIEALRIINRGRIAEGKPPVSSLKELEEAYKQEGLVK
jgi:hypothetical protein